MMNPQTFRARGVSRLARGAAYSAFWVLVTAATGVLAQETAAPAKPSQPAAGSAQSDAGLTEIIVTAQRRSENLQDVPISVTAITAEMLESRGVAGTGDLAAAVPGLTLNTQGYLRPFIRGIGDNAVGPGFEGGVALYIDGVYQGASYANLFSLSNIDRIEVLKGPQGTLFGRNSTGGLIQIITLEPSETFGGNASLTAANYEDYTGDLYVTGGLAPGVALNFAAHAESQGEGWGREQFNGGETYRINHDISLRSSLLIEPSDATKIRVTADYSNTSGNVATSIKLFPGTTVALPGYIPPTGSPWNTNEDLPGFTQMWNEGLSANVTQELGFASLNSITAYRKSRLRLLFDGDDTNVPFINIDNTTPDNQFSQELQLTSNPGSRLKWTAGVFYYDASSKFDPAAGILPAMGLTQLIYSTLGTRSVAGYAQATAPLTDDTNLELGVRDTQERKNITDSRIQVVLPGGALPPAAIFPTQSVKNNTPTWRVSLDHRFSPEAMVYASYNRGFKSGGFNGQNPGNPAFLPEKLDAYEIGTKTDLFDRRLRLNASTFYYNYKNIQVTRYVNSSQVFYNGPSATVYGLDADFEAKLTRRFSLSGGFTVLHDRFGNFPNAVYTLEVPTGVMVTTGQAEGNRLPFTADFSGTITGVYTIPTTLGEASFDASYTYNNGYFSQVDNILRQPAFNLVAFGGGLTFHNGLSARVWMRNALNAVVYDSFQAGTFDTSASLEAPRTFGLTLSAKF